MQHPDLKSAGSAACVMESHYNAKFSSLKNPNEQITVLPKKTCVLDDFAKDS